MTDTLYPAQSSGEPSTADAVNTLKAALAADPSFAWSWHCAVWSCVFDEGVETGAANRAAARFMHMAFDVDTSKNANFRKPETTVADADGVHLSWAVDRWNDEVKHRPLVNVHRRSLDDTWRQVIRHFGGDPDALVGPSHDELLSRRPTA